MQECSTHIQVKQRKKLLKYYYASYTYIYMYHVVFAVSLNYPNRLHPLDMRMQYFLEYLLICLFTIPGKACIIFHFNLFKMYISKIGVDNECYIYLLFEIHEYQFGYCSLHLNKDINIFFLQNFVNFDFFKKFLVKSD